MQFSTALFEAAGLDNERASVMASVFLEADLLGFTTHGMNRVASNLTWLAEGQSRITGEPEVLADRGLVSGGTIENYRRTRGAGRSG